MDRSLPGSVDESPTTAVGDAAVAADDGGAASAVVKAEAAADDGGAAAAVAAYGVGLPAEDTVHSVYHRFRLAHCVQ